MAGVRGGWGVNRRPGIVVMGTLQMLVSGEGLDMPATELSCVAPPLWDLTESSPDEPLSEATSTLYIALRWAWLWCLCSSFPELDT